jgi:hypothetical protein
MGEVAAIDDDVCLHDREHRVPRAVGFHDISTLNRTLALDLTLARGIRLIHG